MQFNPILHPPKDLSDARLYVPAKNVWSPELFEGNRQPVGDVEIDWSFPITRGMDGIYVFKNQTANHDLSGKQEPLILGSATFSSTNKGIAINLDDSEYATIANFTPTTNNTWAYWLKAIAHDSANSRIFGMENAYEARFAFDSPTWNITNEFGVETVTVQEGWTDSVQVEDVWYFVVQVTDAGGRDILFTCLNGVVDSNDTGGGHIDLDPGATYSTGTMTIGNRTGAVDTDAFQGQMGGLLYHWDRALTIPEALSLSRNNYYFLKPKGPPMVNVKKADILQIPERRFEYPALFEPNKQPSSDVVINWDDPITNGLIRCWVGNSFTDLVDNVLMLDNGGSTAIGLDTDDGDVVLAVGKVGAGRAKDASGLQGISGGSERTVMVICNNRDADGSSQMFSLGENSANARWTIRNDNGALRLENAAANSSISTGIDFDDALYHTVIVRQEKVGTTIGDANWFADGKSGNFSGSSEINTTSTPAIRLCDIGDSTSRDRNYKLVLVWNREITDGERWDMWTNYNRIFIPK